MVDPGPSVPLVPWLIFGYHPWLIECTTCTMVDLGTVYECTMVDPGPSVLVPWLILVRCTTCTMVSWYECTTCTMVDPGTSVPLVPWLILVRV